MALATLIDAKLLRENSLPAGIFMEMIHPSQATKEHRARQWNARDRRSARVERLLRERLGDHIYEELTDRGYIHHWPCEGW